MILVDIGPLVALCDPRDRKHKAALGQVEKLTPRGLLVCEAVLTEACFHLPHAVQRRRLRALLEALRIRPATECDDATFRWDAFGWLETYEDHEPDWADACLAVLSARNPLFKVWTYDHEFATTWRRPDGTVIPLAAALVR